MVRLQCACRDNRVAALRERLSNQIFQLSRLVAASGKAGAVITLDEEPGNVAYSPRPERFAQTMHFRERRRQMGERQVRKIIQRLRHGSDHSLGPEGLYLLRRVAEFAEYGVGVLAEKRRPFAKTCRRAGET